MSLMAGTAAYRDEAAALRRPEPRPRPDQLWIADVTVRPHGNTALTALGVAQAKRRMPATIALRDALARMGMEGEVRLRATLQELPLQEAADMAQGIGEYEARLGRFGFDDPRGLDGYAGLNMAPEAGEMVADGQILQDLLFSGGDYFPASEQVYAVLDGARVFGLAELLENSGLEHRCLFNGKAAEDYAVTAPRLVKLLPGHRLTRTLTDVTGKKGALSWAEGPGLLIRSPLSIDGLRRQLRAYTLILDTARNRRVYFRFYDPRSFRTLIAGSGPESRAKFARGISMIACPTATNDMMIFARP